MSTDTFGTEAERTDDVETGSVDTEGIERTETERTDTLGTETDGTETDGTEKAGTETAGTDRDGTEKDDVSADAESEDVQQSRTADDSDGSSDDGEGSRNSDVSRRSALEAEGDIAADFLEALLDICDIVGDIDVDVDGDRAAVSIVDSEDGRVPRRLVGPDGKVLESLQELTRLAVQSETGQRSRLMLDIAGHRAARRADIVEVARGVIGEVKETGSQVELEPMSAFERKIVHDEVLAAGLRSESDGVEPHRFVVVLPAE